MLDLSPMGNNEFRSILWEYPRGIDWWADYFGVSSRTIGNWISGGTSVPFAVAAVLRFHKQNNFEGIDEVQQSKDSN